MNGPEMRLVKASDYFKSLMELIPQAKKRVVIHTMTLLWAPRTETIIPALREALGRGVEVRIVGDYYSKFQANRPKIVRPETKTPKWAYTRALNYRLEGAGANITYVGKIGLNPFKGRCHSKITIIDDTVFTFGGINFTDDSFDNYDYMLSFTDTALADRLYALIREIEQDTVLGDLREQVSPVHTLLFDGGKPGTSAIYETACDIVAAAAKVYYVSQMCPSGRLAGLIAATDNYCYFARPAQAEPPANFALLFDATRHHINNRYKGKRFIHAKFILCEGKDGTKHVLSGSNNFSWRSIVYGTKEIALHSTDPKLWQTMYDYSRTIAS